MNLPFSASLCNCSKEMDTALYWDSDLILGLPDTSGLDKVNNDQRRVHDFFHQG